MSQDPPSAAPPGASVVTPDEEAGSSWRRWTVLLPAGTFLVGVLLGGAVVGAAGQDDDGSGTVAQGSPSASPTPTASGDGDLVVTVPGPCVQVADRAEAAYALLDRGIAAARDLDAGALAELVDEVQRDRPEVQALVQRCREAGAANVVEPEPEPTA